MRLITTALIASLALFSCVDDQDMPLTEDTSLTEQEVGTGSAAGKVACWKLPNPNALCTVPTLQAGPPSDGATRCVWHPTNSLYSGMCHTGSVTGYSETNCDGPEDCWGTMRCCAHKVGGVFKSSCQSTTCSTGPVRDPLHVQLCHTNAQCVGTPWPTCTATTPGADGLPQGLGVCK